MSMPTAAMILAAGLGTRMRPLTNRRPKALVRVGDTCLLDHALGHARQAGVKRCVVNMHYCAEQIVDHVMQHPWRASIHLSDEQDGLLETGGGVLKALPLLGLEPFYVLNADYLWFERRNEAALLAQLQNAWDADQMDVLLALQPLEQVLGYQGAGDFMRLADGRLERWPAGTQNRMTGVPMVYIGAHITSPALFEGVPLEPFSLNRLWDQARAAGRLYGFVYKGTALHISTPADVTQVNARLAQMRDDAGLSFGTRGG